MRTFIKLLLVIVLPAALAAKEPAAVVVREIHYDGRLTDNEARFGVDLDLEATGPGESTLTLFDGELTVLPARLPANLRLERDINQYRLVVSRAGRYKFSLDLVAKISRAEPWNRVSFTGPEAVIAVVTAQASGAGVEVQLLSGTLQELVTKEGVTRARGFLGPERTVAVRWQTKAAEVSRKALLTCETTAAVQVTPTVVKYTTELRYEIVQGSAPRLVLMLPATHALTKLQGEQVRDWQLKPEGGQQVLSVEFIKPVEKAYTLTLLSEQPVESGAAAVQIAPPQPQEVERESGSLTVSAEDVLVETDGMTGLRQVNAATNALAAYQFYGRPFTLALRLRRIEPVVNAADRVTVRLEETRLLVTHALTLTVEKAGIYALELTPQTGFVVADVRGDGVEDWKSTGGKLLVNFNSRVLGSRKLEVQLERSGAVAAAFLPRPGEENRDKNVAPTTTSIIVEPLRVAGAVKETAQLGATAAPGLQLKTAAEGLTGLREVPITLLANRADETLAYVADQADWKLALAAERMAARITADVFNLITIGDGLLGGSATIRLAIINQGVQEFRIKVPALWKNVEFTGPNIRRKELDGDTWVIGLQEKAWGGYTLVVTYDYQFDPHRATLPIGGIHPDGVERETGSIAVTSAANLQLAVQPSGDSIRRVDETELVGNDRALVTRPVLMAYKYQGPVYGLAVDVTRFEELPVLDAVADRTQLTTVLTDAGQMLSQASFMVKNNDRQYQTFTLPAGADFWACYVAGEPVKPEKNGAKLLVPLPRRANRDQSFAVDIVYAQKIGSLKTLTPRSVALAAPVTDMQTTYAEWELYVPATHRLAGFGGNMIVARGTTYGLRDAWLSFCRFYDALYRNALPFTLMFLVVAGLVFLVVVAIRRGWRGAMAVIVVVVLVGLFAAMLLPALSSARGKARQAASLSNLKQIGLGLAMFADQHGGQLPVSLDELKGIVGSEKIFVDVDSGGRFDYVGAGKNWQENGGDSVLAYSPIDRNGRNVLFSDGHVQWMNGGQFGDALSKTMVATGKEQLQAAAEESSQPKSDINAEKLGAASVRGPGGGGFGQRAGPMSSQALPASGAATATTQPTAPAAPPAIRRIPFGADHGGLETPAEWSMIVAGGGAVAPMVAGIRPIRIDIPRTGVRFVFTKVLNVRGEPLAVRAVAMDQKVFKAVRGCFQAVAFVAGLVLVWWQWRRSQPNSLVLTAGLALAIGAVVSLLLSWRVLGEAMIVAAPVVALAVVVWVVRKLWKRGRKTDDGGPKTDGGMTAPVTPPVITAMAVLLCAATVAQAGGAEKRCAAVPATAAGGQSFGQVEAGKFYRYEASGWVGVNSGCDGPCSKADPDGYEVSTREADAKPQRRVADKSPRPICRDTWQYCLVARVDGGQCQPLGKSGSFLAPASGELRLYINDGNFSDNSGAWDVCVWEDTAGPVITSKRPAVKPAPVTAPPDSVQPAAGVSILSAAYNGAVRSVDGPAAGRVVELEAMFEMEAAAPNQTVRLFGSGVAVQQFTGPKGGGWLSFFNRATDARLVRDGQNISVLLPQPGRAKVRVKFLVKLAGDVAKRQIAFAIPPALTSRVAVTIDEPEALVEVPGAVAFKSTPSGQQTLVEAVLGAGDRVELNWTPRMKRAAETAATVFCQNASLVTFGGGVVNVRSVLDYQVTQGELRQVQVKLPAGQRLMRVEGESIRTWKLDGQTLNVELVKGVTPAYRLTVETEKLQEAPPTVVKVETPHAADVKRETGLVALLAGGELSLFIETQQELQKVDVEEFVKAWSVERRSEKTVNADAPTTAYRFLRPEFALIVRVEAVQPQIEAAVRNFVRISTDETALRAVVDYTIKRAGVFAVRLQLPADYRVERVTGPNISQWVEKPGTPRVLEVTLKERTMGAYTLTVELTRSWRELPKSVPVVGVQPLDTEKLTGFVAVSAEEGVQIKSEAFAGLTEVPASLVTGAATGASTLAYKLIPTEPAAVGPGWQLAVATERIESWVRAEVMNTLTLTETLVSGRSVVRYEVQNAPTKEFRVRVPAAFKSVEITGANIRRKDRDETTGEWRVELQNKVRGAYALTVTWELPWNVKDGKLELPGVEAAGVERETGALAVLAPARLRLDPQAVGADLLKIDARDLPEWTERTSEPPVLCYRYLRPGYKLALGAQRFEEAEVLQALVDNVRLTTVVSEDGQMMTEMALAVRNNALQYLNVTLPEGAQVWSAFVAGQPVRPSLREGKLLLPMERSGGDATVAVELTYVGAGPFPRRRGGVALASPAVDVPLKNARWELYLPPDYSYSDFEGSMKRELAEVAVATAVQTARTFSLSEYADAENKTKVARDADVSSSLSNARSQLSGGKLGDAVNLYNRAKQSVATDDYRANEDLKKLEKDLRREQGRGLLQAQSSYWERNAGQVLNAPAQSGVPQSEAQGRQAAVQMQYDEAAAEQQAAKLQQAQEVTVAKALPLRVNLPKRGVRVAFSQVLQTEVGKPMSVQFTAVNERVTGWPTRIVVGGVGLVGLWLVVTLAMRKRS